MRRNKPLAILVALVMLDAALVISGLAGDVTWRDWFVVQVKESTPVKFKLTSLGIAHVVGWTIAPPAWG